MRVEPARFAHHHVQEHCVGAEVAKERERSLAVGSDHGIDVDAEAGGCNDQPCHLVLVLVGDDDERPFTALVHHGHAALRCGDGRSGDNFRDISPRCRVW